MHLIRFATERRLGPRAFVPSIVVWETEHFAYVTGRVYRAGYKKEGPGEEKSCYSYARRTLFLRVAYAKWHCKSDYLAGCGNRDARLTHLHR